MEGEKPMKQGFSLVEIVVTLAVLGILLGIGGINWIRYQRVAAVREAAALLATDLVALRSQARRVSQDQVFSIKAGAKTYTKGATKVTLPNGVTVSKVVNGDIRFEAPYGTVQRSSGFTLKGFENIELQVNVIGVGGKVVVRAP
jgi:prepilin-type N-terminal cleavage/methylation domain-containing protein